MLQFLFISRVDGVPSLGWHDTIAFLSIPIFLTISQVISMNIMQPKSDDPQQQQANVILKVLPFMIGWFALNVPSALGIYWVVNNIVTTASTMYVRSIMPPPVVASGGGSAAASSAMEAQTTDFSNPTSMNQRASGFGSAGGEDTMKTITPIDAEIVSGDEGDSDGPDIPSAPKGKVSNTQRLYSAIKFRPVLSQHFLFNSLDPRYTKFRGERRRRGETKAFSWLIKF